MLTARGEETDRIVGLELGRRRLRREAVQPEGAGRSRARGPPAHARGARGRQPSPARRRRRDRPADGCASRVDGRAVELTPTEFQLLATLAREPGRVFTRGQLLDAIHGVAIESYERAIDAHVKNIRKKLEPEPGTPAVRPDGPRRRISVRR